MNQNYLFQNNKKPLNFQIIENPYNTKRLLATKFNSEIYQIVHLLIGDTQDNKLAAKFQLYNWNITSNLIQLNYVNYSWDCSIKCQISATATFFLLENPLSSYLYTIDSTLIIIDLLKSYQKNSISILNESRQIRKKSDINKRNFVFASGKDLLTLSSTNSTLIFNIFPIPLIYNFNPNNFVLDTKLYQNRLYIMYRSIATYNVYLYEFQQAQLLFLQYPNNTKLDRIGINIREVFRFNNNYISKVIRFVRGVDSDSGTMIIWAYNENEAYKCNKLPCLGFGYEIYNNIVFSSVVATNRSLAFFGRSNVVDLKKFKPNLISEQIGKFYFSLDISLTQIITYSNYTVTKLLIATSASIFPSVYSMVSDCKEVNAYEEYNFCLCRLPYVYDPTLASCILSSISIHESSLDTVYIAFIAICSILILTLVFIIYRKVISLKQVRIAWKYNPAQNIIFQ